MGRVWGGCEMPLLGTGRAVGWEVQWLLRVLDPGDRAQELRWPGWRLASLARASRVMVGSAASHSFQRKPFDILRL